MNIFRSSASLLGLVLLWSCVTVNIYFPEAAAEQALRGVAQDILDTQPGAGGSPAPETKSSPAEPGASLKSALGNVLAMLIPAAHAEDQPNINVQTPLALKLRASLKQRQAKLDPYYRSGAIGLSSNFKPVARDLNLVPLQERVALKKMLSDDAQDRTALFSEIARGNGHPEWEENLRSTFERVFFEETPAGYWYQDAQGQWKQKGG
jgi:uncharacterized protein